MLHRHAIRRLTPGSYLEKLLAFRSLQRRLHSALDRRPAAPPITGGLSCPERFIWNLDILLARYDEPTAGRRETIRPGSLDCPEDYYCSTWYRVLPTYSTVLVGLWPLTVGCWLAQALRQGSSRQCLGKIRGSQTTFAVQESRTTNNDHISNATTGTCTRVLMINPRKYDFCKNQRYQRAQEHMVTCTRDSILYIYFTSKPAPCTMLVRTPDIRSLSSRKGGRTRTRYRYGVSPENIEPLPLLVPGRNQSEDRTGLRKPM